MATITTEPANLIKEKLIKQVCNARVVTTVDIVVRKGNVSDVFLCLMSNGTTPRFIPKVTHSKEEFDKIGFDTELTYTLEYPQGVDLQKVLEKINTI